MSETIHRELRMPVPYVVVDEALRRLDWTWRGLQEGSTAASPRELTMRLWHDDPVLFGECVLIDRDTGALWKLFDYQAPAARYRGNAVYRCAAEVGKTREIVLDIVHCGYFERGDQLTGGATDGSLDDIWDELMYQFSSAPILRALIDRDGTKVKPYRKLALLNGNRAYFRPAGHDGRAFRGIHVARRARMEEAALLEAPRIWSEFWRAAKHGCIKKLYSVPTDIPSDYHRIASRAPLYRPDLPYVPGRYVLFHWSREQMPYPHWSPEREATLIEEYGGRDSPGYRRNVLGLSAEPEETVFPRDKFEQCVCNIKEYRYLLFEVSRGELRVTVHRLSAGWRSSIADDETELDPSTAHAIQVEDQFAISVDDIDPQPLEAGDEGRQLDAYETALGLLRPYVSHLRADHPELVCGADLGRARDPAEVLVAAPGELWRWVLRMSVRGLDWRHQAVLYAALDELLGYPNYGWGIDATAGGSGVEQAMRSLSLPGDHQYRTRLSGFLMGEKVDQVVLATGEVLEGGRQGGARRLSRKELGTRLLEQQIQDRSVQIPHDPDYLSDFPRHTARELASGERRFSDISDHTIDSARCATLRWYEVEHGGLFRGSSAPAVQARERDRTPRRDMGRAFRR